MSLFKKKKNGQKVVNPSYSLGFSNFSRAFFFRVFPIIWEPGIKEAEEATACWLTVLGVQHKTDIL